MADKLIVRDFGPIKNAELNIKKTTVLIGPQGSGKSTLAKLVAMQGDNILHYFLTREADFRFSFLIDYQLQSYSNDDSFFEIIGRERILSYLNSNFQVKINDSFVDREEVLNKTKLVNGEFYTGSVIDLFNKVSKSIYIPAERILYSTISEIIFSLASGKIPVPKSILDFGNKFESARREILEFQTIISDVKYSFSGGRDKITSQNKSIALSESASGYQALVPMQLVIEHLSNEKLLEFIIEEPELNLYPTTQKKLIYYLAEKCTKRENQLLLTTHSPYVLSSLNNLLFAYKVAQKHPEHAEEIAKIIPKESWLNPDDFAAYFVSDGTVRSITSPITGLIAENELDGVSEDIGDEFNALMEIYRTKNETSH